MRGIRYKRQTVRDQGRTYHYYGHYVRLYRLGRAWEKWFADSKHGGRQGSHQAACAWASQMRSLIAQGRAPEPSYRYSTGHATGGQIIKKAAA